MNRREKKSTIRLPFNFLYSFKMGTKEIHYVPFVVYPIWGVQLNEGSRFTKHLKSLPMHCNFLFLEIRISPFYFEIHFLHLILGIQLDSLKAFNLC